ncbi:MAG: tetratricopeptide repeat protein [PVC group bacterium]|nr:tetratricopeptide repeat protein [PVC group bacterium]
MKKHITLFMLLALIFTGCVIYAGAINGQFIWDDHLLIKDNVYIKSWNHLQEIFTQDYGAGVGREYHLYRPLQILSYVVEHSLWKLDVRGYHIVNIGLHILNSLFVFFLCMLLFKDRTLAFITALLFLSHPVHTETVIYLSNRGDLLATFFILLCCILYMGFHERKSVVLYIFIPISCLAAVFSKEQGLILPFLLLIYHYAFGIKIKKGRFVSISVLLFVYVILRITLLKSFLPGASAAIGMPQRIPGFFAAITNYLRLLILPVGLHMDYGNNMYAVFHPLVLIGIGITGLAIKAAVTFRKQNPLFTFSILWFFAALLPFSNIYPLPFYMSEHYVYIPSIGFLLIVAYGVRRFLKTPGMLCRITILGLGIVVGIFGILTIRQAAYWKDPISFYERTLQYAPDSARINHNLGDIYNIKEEFDLSIGYYEKAIKLDPNQPDTYNSLGVVYQKQVKLQEAEALFRQALKINPKFIDARNNLGVIYHKQGELDKALREFKHALAINPNYTKAYLNSARIYYALGQKEKAVDCYKKALETDPSDSGIYYTLGILYHEMGQADEAIGMFKNSLRGNTQNVDAYYNLGVVYAKQEQFQEAIAMLKKAKSMDESAADICYALGSAYSKMEEIAQAIAEYEKALKINPNYAQAHNNIALLYFHNQEYTRALEHCEKALSLGGIVNLELLEALEPYR